jgi:K+-transporting ATPase KdpF subunit
VTMLVTLLWAAGAVVVAGYMLVALLRPEKF